MHTQRYRQIRRSYKRYLFYNYNLIFCMVVIDKLVKNCESVLKNYISNMKELYILI